MLINSSIISWSILSAHCLCRNKLLTFIQGMRFLELLSTFWRTRMIRKISQRKRGILRLVLEWVRFQLAMSIKWLQIPREVMTPAKDKKVLSKATKETWEMHNFKWKSNRSNRKYKRRKEHSWVVWWKKPKNCLLRMKESWWLMKILRECWNISIGSWTVRLITRSTSLIEITLRLNLPRKLLKMRSLALPKRRKKRNKRSTRKLCTICSHFHPKSSKDTRWQVPTGIQSTRTFLQ